MYESRIFVSKRFYVKCMALDRNEMCTRRIFADCSRFTITIIITIIAKDIETEKLGEQKRKMNT